MGKNYGKNITSIQTPVLFHLPDGSTKLFSNSLEAQAWFDLNYSDGYSMLEHSPTLVDLSNPTELPEVTVIATSPKEESTPSTKGGANTYAKADRNSSFDRYFYGTSDWDALFGKSRVLGVRRAWQRNPEVMLAFTDGLNIAATVPVLAAAPAWLSYLSAAKTLPAVGELLGAGSTTMGGLTAAGEALDGAAILYGAYDGGKRIGTTIKDASDRGNWTWGNTGQTLFGLTEVLPFVIKTAPKVVNGVTEAYDSGLLWDKYTTLGGRFGYWGKSVPQRIEGTIARRLGLGTDPLMPELIRAEKGHISFRQKTKEGMRFPWMNSTTTEQVRDHKNGKWTGNDLLVFDPKQISPNRYLSTEPMDTYVTGIVNPGKGLATIVSGDIDLLQRARANGYETLSSPRLRRHYSLMILTPTVENPPLGITSMQAVLTLPKLYGTPLARAYTTEANRLISRRGHPTLDDYNLLSQLTGLPLPRFDYPNINSWRPYPTTLQYNPAPPVESNFRSRIGMNKRGLYGNEYFTLSDELLQQISRIPTARIVPNSYGPLLITDDGTRYIWRSGLFEKM